MITRIENSLASLQPRHGLCLYYAKHVQNILREHGYNAVIQAGSLQWPCIRPEDDDGVSPTHFAYMWDPDNITSKFAVASGMLPEMHCWVGIIDTQEIVDFSVRFLKNAAVASGVKWTADNPPEYLWCNVENIPENVVYRPNRDATLYAINKMASI